jgi:hypothetical protein
MTMNDNLKRGNPIEKNTRVQYSNFDEPEYIVICKPARFY